MFGKGTDFNLYSSFTEAGIEQDNKEWRYCNYDDHNIGMFRDCSPYLDTPSSMQWTSRVRGGLGAAFYIYCPEEPADTDFFWRKVLTLQNPQGVSPIDVGREKFNACFQYRDKSTVDKVVQSNILYRHCPGCSDHYRHLYYRRLRGWTGAGWDIDLYSLTKNWVSENNILNAHFGLYSSLQDAIDNVNSWGWCNYDEGNWNVSGLWAK